MKGICMSAYFLLVCVSIVSMLLDVLALYVGDLQVEVFPITVSIYIQSDVFEYRPGMSAGD